MKQRVKFIIRLALTLTIVGVILWQLGGLGEVSQIILQMDPRYVLLGILMMTLDRALMTYKWVRLLRGRGVHLPFFLGMQIYCAAMIWGMLLPATMGADAIRAFSTSRKGFNANDVVASIIIERMVGFLAVLLLGLFSLVLLSASGALDERFNFVWLMSAAVLLAGTLDFAMSFSRRAFELIHSRILYRFQENGLFRRLRQFHET